MKATIKKQKRKSQPKVIAKKPQNANFIKIHVFYPKQSQKPRKNQQKTRKASKINSKTN